MTNKRDYTAPWMMFMAAMLVPSLAAEPSPPTFWNWDAARGGIVHAGNDGEPVVLCMQGRKVVMQVQVDRPAGLSYKARFFNVDPDLSNKGRVMAEVGAESNPALQVDGRPVQCGIPSTVAFDGMLTVVYPACGGIVATRTVYPSLRNPVVIDEWQLKNTTEKPLTVNFSIPGKMKAATEMTELVWTSQDAGSNI
ncbi:MAG: hypothetical protein RLZZ522_1291, partial [Verrucomicrobiota bacterium]